MRRLWRFEEESLDGAFFLQDCDLESFVEGGDDELETLTRVLRVREDDAKATRMTA